MSVFRGGGQPFAGDNEDEEEDEEAEEERCRLPRGKDRLTWLIENLAQHFAATKRVYSYVKDVCTVKSCPSMTAGPQYEYLWIDEVGYSQPTKLPACKYISRLFSHWCDLILLDHTFGPPQGCEELLGTVFRRLFRVYGHIYYSHLRKIVARRKEAELNRYFKRLVLFSWHHKLIPPSEMEPLQSLINTLLCIKPYCYLATGSGLVAAHAYRRATFTLQAVERNHSAIGSGGDRLTCHIRDLSTGNILPAYIQDRKDGTYTVAYLPTEPGRFSFHFSSLTKTKVVAEGFKVQVFPSLASDLIKVLSEEHFADVTFKAGDTRNAIRAHKIIINSRLKGFEILNIIDEIQLSSSVRETTFREFIKYIYTGYVDTRNMKNYMIAELMLMAKNYGLPVLERALERLENGGQDADGDDARKDAYDDDLSYNSDEEVEEEEYESDEESDKNIIEGLGYGSDGEDASRNGTSDDETVDSDYVGRRPRNRKKVRDGLRRRMPSRKRRVINDLSYRDYGSDFEKCINSWKFSDFILSIHVTMGREAKNVPVRNIYTHKLFLFARSGFFRELFTVYRDLRKTNIVICDEAIDETSAEQEKSEEKKNFIYVSSYYVFLMFLKWIYTDAVDLHLKESEHMLKLFDHPQLVHRTDPTEDHLMNELLSLAKKFKAVGLIAVLIQHKNQKDKSKRERQRARELASRSTSPRRKQRDALLKSASGSKKKGSGIRKGDIKKLIASSPSTTSTNSVPTYPYGEVMSIPTNSEQKEITYPYGDMSPSAPSHMSLRMAYDSDGDDAMDLKKANARARRNVSTGTEGSKTASGEYRTGLMRLVASSNTPAPVSPTSAQQSPFAMAHLREPSLHSIPLGGRSTSTPSALPTFSIPSTSPAHSSNLAPSSSAPGSTGQSVLFSLPAYTPPAFSIPATTIRQGGQRTSSPLTPPITPSSSPFSNSHSPGSTRRAHPFSIPTLLIEEAPPLATAPPPSSLSTSSSLSANAYLSAPRPIGINQELRPAFKAQPTQPAPSQGSSGYSDLETEPMLSSSSPFPPPSGYFTSPYSDLQSSYPPQPISATARGVYSSPLAATTTTSNTTREPPRNKAQSSTVSPTKSTSSPSFSSHPYTSASPHAPSVSNTSNLPLASSVTTAGLGSSPSKGSLKSSHSRNHSVPDVVIPSRGGIAETNPSTVSHDEVSFLKNGRVTMLTALERTKSKGKASLKSSKGSRKKSKKNGDLASKNSGAKKTVPGLNSEKNLEISRRGSASSSSKAAKASDNDDSENVEDEEEIEDDSDDEEYDSSDASGSSSHRRKSSYIVRADLEVVAQKVITKSALKENWRDSL